MKRDDVLKLEAGVETDFWVAEAVMDWHVVTNKYGYKIWANKDNRLCEGLDVWKPSVNIVWAWQVAEWLFARGILRISNGDGDSCDCDWFSYGELMNKEKLRDKANVTEETFPLAICRAALLAVAEE